MLIRRYYSETFRLYFSCMFMYDLLDSTFILLSISFSELFLNDCYHQAFNDITFVEFLSEQCWVPNAPLVPDGIYRVNYRTTSTFCLLQMQFRFFCGGMF